MKRDAFSAIMACLIRECNTTPRWLPKTRLPKGRNGKEERIELKQIACRAKRPRRRWRLETETTENRIADQIARVSPAHSLRMGRRMDVLQHCSSHLEACMVLMTTLQDAEVERIRRGEEHKQIKQTTTTTSPYAVDPMRPCSEPFAYRTAFQSLSLFLLPFLSLLFSLSLPH
jgi:hypothetical protein